MAFPRTIMIAVLALVVWTSAFESRAAPLPGLGPFDIGGTVIEVRWFPKSEIKGIRGLSGSAGRDRTVSAHLQLTLAGFTGIDHHTAQLLTHYVDPSDPLRTGVPSKTVLIRINHPDPHYLRPGMRIGVRAYMIRGDEGGTWTSFSDIMILRQPPPDDPYRRYLESRLIAPGFGGKVFCAYELIGTETAGTRKHVFLWAHCMEFRPQGNYLAEGTGLSLPVFLVSIPSCHGELIETHCVPADGEEYGNSVRKIFPVRYHKAIFTEGATYDRRARTLQRISCEKAKRYFGLTAR